MKTPLSDKIKTNNTTLMLNVTDEMHDTYTVTICFEINFLLLIIIRP